MATPTVYVYCDANCKWEGMTKEQILAAIAQAVNEGTIGECDTGFVQTIKTINGHALKFFVGEQSEYDTLTEADKKDLFAIITNDTNKEGLLNAINTLQTEFAEFKNGIEKGTVVVPRAANAKKASEDGNGNVIAETYGNFARNWKSGGLMANGVSLEGQGIYLFAISVKDAWATFHTSAIAYYFGYETFITLNNQLLDSNRVVSYRLKITADGVASVQRASRSENAFIGYADVENDVTSGYSASTSYKKLF